MKTSIIHQTFVWWALYILYQFVKFPIRHLGLAIGNVQRVQRFSPTLPTLALSTISRPLSNSMCSITPETAKVGSSYNRMRGQGIGCWFSDRSNCSHWSLALTFTLTSENLSLYTTLLLLLVLKQLCSRRCWHLDSNYCRTRCRKSQQLQQLHC